MTTTRALLDDAHRRLGKAGVEAPRREARLLLEAASGLSRTRIMVEPDREIGADRAAEFEQLLAERVARKPMAYIRGTQEFYGTDFAVGPGVLVPRPETELLVDVALRRLADMALDLRILDLGTGSGCLLLTLLHQLPRATGLGVDISPEALSWARRNLYSLELGHRASLELGHWCRGITERFDLIVANPPYIGTDDIAGLEPEVQRHEPRAALDGGPDGLLAYLEIAPDLGRVLAPGGTVLLECGSGQAGALDALFVDHGFIVSRHRDLAGIERCLELTRSG